MATSLNSNLCHYEYMDEAHIDSALQCSVCTQPFQKPVSLVCQHVFCQNCIETWLNSNNMCPLCRKPTVNSDSQRQHSSGSSKKHLFSPVNLHIVIEQLDRLLVRCNHCQQINIERGNFPDHESKCAKKLVQCLSADIQCSWIGPRDEQSNHLVTCSFQQIRPIIQLLQDQLLISSIRQNDLETQLQEQSKQLNFLRAFINKGNSMTRECQKELSECRYGSKRKHIKFQCTLCQKKVSRKDVVLHVCSTKEKCDCICLKCYNDQYSSSENESDAESSDD